MSIIYLLAPLALILGFGFLGLFCWSVSQGQCDDLETPARRMLIERKKDEN